MTSKQHEDCVFCRRSALAIVDENALAFAVRDISPVKPLHTLIIPKRHVESVFDASAEEREAIFSLAVLCRARIEMEDSSVGGFNFGSNIGHAAGQKVLHAHVHLIPRRMGDLAPPPARPAD